MKTRTHFAHCPQEYLTAFGLDPQKVIYFDIETTGFRASTSSLYMIGWAVREDFSRGIATGAERTGTAVDDDMGKADAGLEDIAGDERTGIAVDDGMNEVERESRTKKDEGPDFKSDCTPGWIVTQIMAESSSEEILLLEQFETILRRYDTIIEFNGDRFDLPYMKEKYASHNLSDPFEHCRTVDLYREIRPYKNIFGMSRLNQKSVEKFLHITRKDPYNGGELIDVYRSVRNHSCSDEESAVNALFLHNYEDVLGMLAMTPLLSYRLAMESTAPVMVCRNEDDGQRSGCRIIEAAFTLDVPVPSPLQLVLGNRISGVQNEVDASRENEPKAACCISIAGDQASVTLYLAPLCLYHYFPDYRNYYYLPEEDMAIHKSVASFVDASHRKKATAQNCYVKKQALFLPQAGDHFQPVFQRCYKDLVSWFEYQPEITEDSESFSDYIHALIRAGNVPS